MGQLGADRPSELMSWSSFAVFLAITLPWLNPFSPGPKPAVMPWLVSLASLALLLLFLVRLRRAQMAELAAKAWLAAALISAALGLLQYFGMSAAFEPWVNSTVVGEAFANLRQRNQFATLTNVGLAALLWWVSKRRSASIFLAAGAGSTLLHRRSLVPLAMAALLALANAASSSRTGLAQLLLLIALAWVWSRAEKDKPLTAGRHVLLAAALAYALGALVLPGMVGLDPHASGILARLHDGGPTCASRLTLWRNVLYLIAQKPWFGWGWGELDYAHFITLYPGPRFCEILDNAHNLPLHLAVELGLPLALLVCAAGGWLLWRDRPWRELDATRQMAWAVLAVILLHSMLEYPLWYGPFQVASGLCLWLLWRAPHLKRNDETGHVPVLIASLAALLVAAVAYAAWDYQRVSQIYLVPSLRAPAYRDNTLEKIGTSWLFRDQVQFAELTTTALTPENAQHLNQLAHAMLHFSPEPSVIEKLIESATLLGLKDEALFYLKRYQAAFPESQARWAASIAL